MSSLINSKPVAVKRKVTTEFILKDGTKVPAIHKDQDGQLYFFLNDSIRVGHKKFKQRFYLDIRKYSGDQPLSQGINLESQIALNFLSKLNLIQRELDVFIAPTGEQLAQSKDAMESEAQPVVSVIKAQCDPVLSTNDQGNDVVSFGTISFEQQELKGKYYVVAKSGNKQIWLNQNSAQTLFSDHVLQLIKQKL